MARLTTRTDEGEAQVLGIGHKVAFDRLAAYEDSGLSPEQVQELAKAKAEGRLVGLPCKVGDKVYWVSPFGTGINTGVVNAIKISGFGFDLAILDAGGMIRHREFEKVFLTREAAEKALWERLKNDKGGNLNHGKQKSSKLFI